MISDHGGDADVSEGYVSVTGGHVHGSGGDYEHCCVALKSISLSAILDHLFVCLLFVYHLYILFRPHMKGWAKVLIGKVGAFLSEESFRNSSVLISLISDPPPKYLFTAAFL